MVTYTAPSGYQLASGETNPKTGIVVGVGATVTVSFSVVPQTGSITVSVSGLASNAGSGGSAQVSRTDIGGSPPITLNIPGSGSASTTVAVGTYSVTFAAPSGYQLAGGEVNPKTGIAVTAGANVQVGFAVVPEGGSGVAGNIYEWGFEGASDAEASGNFTTGGGASFIAATSWDRDVATSYRGSQSVRQVYNVSTGNVGDAFYYAIPGGNRSSVYVRFAYRQSNPFNQQGGSSNYDQIKLIRFLSASFSGPYLSVFIGQGSGGGRGQPRFTWDTSEPGQHTANLNTPEPNLNDFLGQWVVFELFVDVSTNNALKFKMWMNGTQYFDYTHSYSNAGLALGVIQFDGTINSMTTQSQANFDTIGISSAPMGFPPP